MEERQASNREQTIEKKKKIMRALRVVLVMLLLIGGIAVVQYARFREYTGYEVMAEIPMYDNLAGYALGNRELIMYSNDGAKGIAPDGEARWEVSYTLDNPQVDWCRDVVSVADKGGTSVYVVAENGIPYNYEVIYPIVKHEVAAQGVTAVLLNDGMDDYIQLRDITGTLRVDINTKTKTDGIPVDIALSEDGKKLVTLYVTFQGESMVCKVTFYNAGEVGKNYISNIVGQKKYAENLLAYDIEFLNEDTLCVLLENGFALYRMTEIPELICEKTLEGEILDVVYVSTGIYIIRKEAGKEKSLTFYDLKGDAKTVWNSVPDYERFAASEEEIVFFSPQSAMVYRKNKSLKFAGEFRQGYEEMYPAGSDRYFLIDAGTMHTIKLSDSIDNKGEEK